MAGEEGNLTSAVQHSFSVKPSVLVSTYPHLTLLFESNSKYTYVLRNDEKIIFDHLAKKGDYGFLMKELETNYNYEADELTEFSRKLLEVLANYNLIEWN